MCSPRISLNYNKRTPSLLTHKLAKYGLTVSVLKIVESYLHERQPVVNCWGINAAHLVVRQQCASGLHSFIFSV